MARFGPFPPDDPRFPMAIAVSGGADSLGLAWLMRRWRRAVIALVVDHGLRAASGDEARLTLSRLHALDIPAEMLVLTSLDHQRSIQENARHARYRMLAQACRERGILDLVIGHHMRDQAETLVMRRAHGSTSHGLAGMAVSRETLALRYLRPLLGIPPERLRATLRSQSIHWIEDPSNANTKFERVRIRLALTPDQIADAVLEARIHGAARDARLHDWARHLGELTVDPLGFAHFPALPSCALLLGRIWQMISGAEYPPPHRVMERLIAAPIPFTFGGALFCAAGKMGSGWLLIREPQAIGGAVPAERAARWDGRFTLAGALPHTGAYVMALGDQARFFRASGLPSRILRGIPAIWREGQVIAVPGLGVAKDADWRAIELRFEPESSLLEHSLWI
ncbi:tRNA lysidine(34) synthetase TilS [Asaia sp. W19]|uniref:tRNA lysidine(34) synthetase TilS n=1 Tax=unclassified Asaia TaxID=2685023 RepID=UPI000F8C8079|nr:tRNA lysidine(34) synthetase TilS [Asaia sp. W19]RUT25422.1 tRNA lysidine(34) synthetase TilS [Asaia sp. W19]